MAIALPGEDPPAPWADWPQLLHRASAIKVKPNSLQLAHIVGTLEDFTHCMHGVKILASTYPLFFHWENLFTRDFILVL